MGDHSLKSKTESFAELARSLGCDEDEARWEERLKAVAKHRPEPEPKEPTDDDR